jgi:hypothetical protein
MYHIYIPRIPEESRTAESRYRRILNALPEALQQINDENLQSPAQTGAAALSLLMISKSSEA